ncbi:MAG: hypothetical protein JNK85_22595 [Verrucomicrobiales bacterium]|nr:hypothetical protein [Verrucomicrobiales bacterium]
MTKIVLAASAYVLISFALAAPWHLVWFKKLYDDLGMYNRAEPMIALGVGSMMVQGLVMALLYPRQYQGGHPVVEGLRFGLLMGLFLFSISTMANAAKIKVEPLSVFFGVQVLFHALQFAATGAAIGAIYGRLPAARP